MRIAALCDNDTAVGLRLAGVNDLFVPNNKTLDVWNKIIERDDIGILFITEKIAEDLGKYLKEFHKSYNMDEFMRNNVKRERKKPDIGILV